MNFSKKNHELHNTNIIRVSKTIKQQLKTIALILSLLILLQGCTVYKSASVTLEEAVMAETKVKVIKKNGEKVKFKRIIFEDGYYKSIEELGGGTVKTQIEVDKIEKVQLKDKVLSTVLSIVIPVVIIGGLLALSVHNSLSKGGWGNWSN